MWEGDLLKSRGTLGMKSYWRRLYVQRYLSPSLRLRLLLVCAHDVDYSQDVWSHAQEEGLEIGWGGGYGTGDWGVEMFPVRAYRHREGAANPVDASVRHCSG